MLRSARATIDTTVSRTRVAAKIERMSNRPPAGARSYQIRVVGIKRQWFGDFYHGALRLPWWAAILAIGGVFLTLNAVFALVYVLTGGIAHARPGSFADAFFFSVQTMATIGYGAMYPDTLLVNVLVVLEAVIGLIVAALATGLVFAKFSQPVGRVAFTNRAVIGPLDGVPNLMIRLGNQRGNLIVEAQVRLVLVRTTVSAEGVKLYRMVDLALVRERSPAMQRSWTVLHLIDRDSPLHGATPESLARDEAEVMVTVTGVDDVSLQLVHARHTYEHQDIVFGARHADILSELPDGDLVLDLQRFHELQPTEPTETFPYPRAAARQ